MIRKASFLEVAVAILTGAASPAMAQFTFQKVADTSTLIAGSGTLLSMGVPAFSQGRLAFLGQTSTYGFYQGIPPTYAAAAELGSPVAGTSENLSGISSSPLYPTIDGSSIYLFGNTPTESVHLVSSNGVVSKVFSSDTPIPSGTGSFTSYHTHLAASGVGVFLGTGTSQMGLYTRTSHGLSKISDYNTAIPSGTGNFVTYSSWHAAQGKVGFTVPSGSGDWQGVYTAPAGGGTLTRIADQSMTAPGTTAAFSFMTSARVSSGGCTFFSRGSSSAGIYTNIGGTLVKVARPGDALPEGGGTFSMQDLSGGPGAHISTYNDRVLFTNLVTGQVKGLYLWDAGTITKVLKVGEDLGGASVTGISIHHQAMDSNQFAFRATTADGPSLWIASLATETAADSWQILE